MSFESNGIVHGPDMKSHFVSVITMTNSRHYGDDRKRLSGSPPSHGRLIKPGPSPDSSEEGGSPVR